MPGPSAAIDFAGELVEDFGQRARGAHGVGHAAAELADAGDCPAIRNFSGEVVELPRRGEDERCGGGVADVEVAGSVFVAEVEWVKRIVAGD